MSKKKQLKNVSQRVSRVKPEVKGYYFDGKKSYTIYIKENRSYMLQDK